MHDDLLHDVVTVEARGGYRVHLRFDNGLEGEIDLAPLIGPFRGVFAPLAAPGYFGRVRVEPDLGTICWPNGADVDPVVLYCAVKGIRVPTCEDAPPRRKPKASAKRAPARHSDARRTSVRHRKTGT